MCQHRLKYLSVFSRQVCSRIPSSISVVGRVLPSLKPIVQETQSFRQVRFMRCVILYIMCVVCIALDEMIF